MTALECGACTVLIDDVPHYSCSVLTHTVRGKNILTIEGLASADGKLHPVQQGVIDEQGFQCAFCMSGFVMATVGYPKTSLNPTRAELAHGISGNLCRCQDYDKILNAMMRGADNLRRANQPLHNVPATNYKLIGKNYTTPDLHAGGDSRRDRNIEDYRADGVLFCKFCSVPCRMLASGHRREGGARDARRQGHFDRGRTASSR